MDKESMHQISGTVPVRCVHVLVQPCPALVSVRLGGTCASLRAYASGVECCGVVSGVNSKRGIVRDRIVDVRVRVCQGGRGR